MVDFIIPLGVGSKSNNDELRLLLRSLDKNGIGCRKVIVVATEPPCWLSDKVEVHVLGDPLKTNKDGNIINKIRYALNTGNVTPEFVWSCDDCVVLDKFDFSTMPPIYNSRSKRDFANSDHRWHNRVYRTFTYLESKGTFLEHNYESHTPQRFPTAEVLNLLRYVNYETDIGYSINTLFYGMLGVTGGFDQRLFKATAEDSSASADHYLKQKKALLGYNDSGFAILRDKLFSLFPHKSKYEK